MQIYVAVRLLAYGLKSSWYKLLIGFLRNEDFPVKVLLPIYANNQIIRENVKEISYGNVKHFTS